MTADFEIPQGATAPIFTDTLTFGDGSVVDLSAATLNLRMRSLTDPNPVTLAGATSSPSPTTGAIQYAPDAADTTIPGDYIGRWHVVFPGGLEMEFPTVGYLTIRVTPNVTGAPQGLVSLAAVKDYLGIAANDRTQDQKLLEAIAAARPVVEQITGPIVQTSFDEWHDGGQSFIQLRRRPRTGYGTSPILTVTSVTEYRAAIGYTLMQVPSPDEGTIYSYMVDRLGTLTRRTTGGGSTVFFPGTNSVHVEYTAGQSSIPWNVHEGTLELIRVNTQTTQPVGRGRYAQTDDLDTGRPLGFYVPRNVRELLAPTGGRAPSIG